MSTSPLDSDLPDVLRETKHFYSELTSRLVNIKEYMNQELETGIYTFEMSLIEKLERKQAELARLIALLSAKESDIEENPLRKSLQTEIKWFKIREELLNSKAAKFGNELIELKRKVVEMRKKEAENRMILWKIQEESKIITVKLQGNRETNTKPQEVLPSAPPDLLSCLPSLNLLFELSPKGLGSLKIPEFHSYQHLKTRLHSAKTRLIQYQTQSQALTSHLITSISLKQDYKATFQTCFDAYMRFTQEITLPKLGFVRSNASTRSNSCELVTEKEGKKRDVVKALAGMRKEQVKELAQRMFEAKNTKKHVKTISFG